MSNVLKTIGNTPLIELGRMNHLPPGSRLLGKVEGVNPGGSIKDRPVLYMIRDAEQSGRFSPSQVLLEPTSGNTGIALAMIGAARGYKVKIVMPACVSQERRAIIEAMGAEVVLTPAAAGTDGAIAKSREMVDREPDRYFMLDQFNNPANSRAHFETTGPEIFRQTEGSVDLLVAGIGTSGTLMGIGEYLRKVQPKVKIIGVEPLPGHKIQGLKNLTESQIPGIFRRDSLDGVVAVTDEEAFAATRLLALQEGIFAGMSSGAALAGAWKAAEDFPGKTVVAILPDRGDRYLSTSLFRSICGQCPP